MLRHGHTDQLSGANSHRYGKSTTNQVLFPYLKNYSINITENRILLISFTPYYTEW